MTPEEKGTPLSSITSEPFLVPLKLTFIQRHCNKVLKTSRHDSTHLYLLPAKRLKTLCGITSLLWKKPSHTCKVSSFELSPESRLG